MLQHERLKSIMEQLKEKGKVDINDLSTQFSVSKVTIRKDLDILQERGSVVRYYGGAAPASETGEISLESNKTLQLKETNHVKDSLAQTAAAHIKDGDAIFLGSGVTCTLLSEYMHRFKNLTVITNNISAVPTLIKNVKKVVVIGGEVITVDGVNFFSWTDSSSQYLDNIFVNKVFTSCTGVDLKAGLTVNSVVSTYLFKCLPNIKREWFLLVEKEKFNKIGLYQFNTIDAIDCFITDGIPSEYIEYFDNKLISYEIV